MPATRSGASGAQGADRVAALRREGASWIRIVASSRWHLVCWASWGPITSTGAARQSMGERRKWPVASGGSWRDGLKARDSRRGARRYGAVNVDAQRRRVSRVHEGSPAAG